MGLLKKVGSIGKKLTKASLGLATGGLLGVAGKMLKSGASAEAQTRKKQEYGTKSVKDYVAKVRARRKAKE